MIVGYDAVFEVGVGGGRRVVERDFCNGERPERWRRSEEGDVGEQMSEAGSASEDLEEETEPVYESSPQLD